jgi:hypothetical protein
MLETVSRLTVLPASGIGDDADFAVAANLDVERVPPAGHIVVFSVDLGVAYLLAIDIEQRNSIGTRFDAESARAVWRDRDCGRRRRRCGLN